MTQIPKIALELSKLIQERRSIYPNQYSTKVIDKDTLAFILQQANWAPTHMLTQPWRFKVVRQEKLKSLGRFLSSKYKENSSEASFSLSKFKKIERKCKQASCVIIICMQKDAKQRIPVWEEVASTAMAVQNMWLICHTLGIGAYWSSPPMIDHMHDFVELNKDEVCLGLFYMGYHEMPHPEGVRTSIEEKVQWI
jgi:nitroreductase